MGQYYDANGVQREVDFAVGHDPNAAGATIKTDAQAPNTPAFVEAECVTATSQDEGQPIAAAMGQNDQELPVLANDIVVDEAASATQLVADVALEVEDQSQGITPPPPV